jgi:hypothetical protein
VVEKMERGSIIRDAVRSTRENFNGDDNKPTQTSAKAFKCNVDLFIVSLESKHHI